MLGTARAIEVKLLLERARAFFTGTNADDLSSLAELFSAADLQDQALAFAEASVAAAPGEEPKVLGARCHVWLPIA